ncbi:MAG: rhamnulokinase [Planctomycetaceae bacterium]|nr:rhamnulokinase [Planctomycetaceae bacterium]
MDGAKNYIAIDLGASSGRVILGCVRDGKILLEEMHRFENGPIEHGDSIRWDFAKLFGEIETGLANAAKHVGKIESISVDSWGVDFGLIDSKGVLFENPYHYRDKRTDTMMDKVFSIVPREKVYEITGIQFMPFNSIYQLEALKLQQPDSLKKTDKIILMADLVSYYLCGEIFSEYTLASTSQLLDMNTGKWSDELFSKLSLPVNIMPKIVQSGSVVGKLKKQIADKLGCAQIPVVATGSHDTASAVASVPATGDNWAYLSSGTWSLMGVEISKPLINESTYKYQFTNEGGVYNTIRLLKNIMGLWLIQECRRNWNQQGEKLFFADMAEMAKSARPFMAVINPNDSRFLAPCDMPAVINEYLVEKGYKKINDKGQMIRVIIESLVFYYRRVLDILEEITGKKIDVLHLVGGGIQNELLCQFTANSIGRKVIAGPVEATAMGNIMVQAITAGQIKNIAEGRKVVAKSFELKIYQPAEHETWDKKYQQIKNVLEI